MMDSMEFTFYHPVTDVRFKASRPLVAGRNFDLLRFDEEEQGWVYCGEVTPYSPQPVQDAMSVRIGAAAFFSSFTEEQQRVVVERW